MSSRKLFMEYYDRVGIHTRKEGQKVKAWAAQ